MTIEDPLLYRGGGETLSTPSFILTGGVNARVESMGVSGGTTTLSGNKVTLASYKHKPTSYFGKLPSTLTTLVNGKTISPLGGGGGEGHNRFFNFTHGGGCNGKN